MALPTTLLADPGVAGHSPPFKSSAGNFYVIGMGNSPNAIEAFKATDPTDAWVIQDTSGNPSHGLGQDYRLLTATQKDDVLYIASEWEIGTIYEYHEFNMASDTWTTTNEEIDATTNDPTEKWISIAVRSDGDVIVCYNGDTDANMGDQKERADYARREGGTWTPGVALDGGGDVHYGNPNVIKGPLTDDMHFSWQSTTATADPPVLWALTAARTLDPSNTLSTQDTDTIDTSVHLLGMQNAVSYDSAGPTQRMLWHGASGAAGAPRIYLPATEDGSDDVTLGTSVSDTAGTNITANGEVGTTTIAELNGDIHQLYGTPGVEHDLYYTKSTDDGATWTTPIQEEGDIDVNFISANIYIRGSDTVMAYVYDDAGVQKYNEKVLIAGDVLQAQVMM